MRTANCGGEIGQATFLLRWLCKKQPVPIFSAVQGHHRDRGGTDMIANDQELKVTRERIARFQEQVAHLRRVETNPENYHGAVSGFLGEIDRMQLEVREYPKHSPG
jgi:hypothetical protein